MPHHLRIAKPVTDLARTTDMYCRGLGLRIIDRFEDHQGFDGVMLGDEDAGYHFEFTHCRAYDVSPTPTLEDLAVFYVPVESEWRAMCDDMLHAGFTHVVSYNPYWDVQGRTFEDHDGYRVVLQRAAWSNSVALPPG